MIVAESHSVAVHSQLSALRSRETASDVHRTSESPFYSRQSYTQNNSCRTADEPTFRRMT